MISITPGKQRIKLHTSANQPYRASRFRQDTSTTVKRHLGLRTIVEIVVGKPDPGALRILKRTRITHMNNKHTSRYAFESAVRCKPRKAAKQDEEPDSVYGHCETSKSVPAAPPRLCSLRQLLKHFGLCLYVPDVAIPHTSATLGGRVDVPLDDDCTSGYHSGQSCSHK